MRRTRAKVLFAMVAAAVAVVVVAVSAGPLSAAGPAPAGGKADRTLTLTLRRRRLVTDERGYRVWRVETARRTVPASAVALVLCDVWDRHWCRGANERLARMLPRMNALVRALRKAGALVVHAPSETMAFYEGTPARRRAREAPPVEPPAPTPHPDPPLPVDASDGGCDTPGDTPRRTWTRQHPAIEIDHRRDAVTDRGRELYNLLRARGIRQVLIMGVHTNMCVLHRSFGIKQLVRWGVEVALVRDLTDTMYNPARPPYVSHEEGTRLVVEFIEAFWCPTVASEEVLAALAGVGE